MSGGKVARPMMSLDSKEAHRRVMSLYKAIYRYIPTLLKYQDIPKNEEDCRQKLREYFYRNADVKDIRVIDILVMKGYMELKEQTHQWQAKTHVMAHWRPTVEPPPCGFIEKFLAGKD